MKCPRAEHPNPQWERENWLCLNGQWEFDFDFGKSALDRKLYEGGPLSKTITVPFCPESKLSGIGYTDFIPAVVYRKTVTLTEEQASGRVLLHFGAVDYETWVYVNGKFVCRHRGGYTPFEADITEVVKAGENTIFVYAEDDIRGGKQCGGKQSHKFQSHGCFYTRVTGIWQTVWLEFVPKAYILSAKYETHPDSASITVRGKTSGSGMVTLKTSFEGEETGSAEVYSTGDFSAVIPLSRTELWELGNGRLYDLTLSMGDDTVHSYFGLRSVGLEGMKFVLNKKTVFQRLVLDQGYYPDGIYTAPDEAALVKDIAISMELGFNGARLHQKLFEPRFLYHCDKMGYMVWDEYGNGNFDCAAPDALNRFLKAWLEVLDRDGNHPSVIGWCPFNETWDYAENEHKNELLSSIYEVTKAVDPTRPCIDASGLYHAKTDIFDVHDYEGNPETFAGYFAGIADGVLLDQIERNPNWKSRQHYNGEPVFVSEYGGIQWSGKQEGDAWGYGDAPKTPEEFIKRYQGVTDVLLQHPLIMGFCYTQLYDVEQEQNGLYTYERQPKFDPEIFRKINQQPAAIEE